MIKTYKQLRAEARATQKLVDRVLTLSGEKNQYSGGPILIGKTCSEPYCVK